MSEVNMKTRIKMLKQRKQEVVEKKKINQT
jgi:hypothetical protein